MPVSVRDVLELPGLNLGLVAGRAGLDNPIRWAHTSELSDPTPWLSGGELLLTTGIGMRGSPTVQRAYIRRLVSAGLAGLGFGVGLGFDEVPPAVVKAAEREGFPILEVPYPVPFIAITEAVSSRLAEDRLKDAQMSVEVHERLATRVLEGAGPADLLDEVAALAGGWAVLFDARGRPLANAGTGMPEAASVWADIPTGLRTGPQQGSASHTTARGTRVALPVVAGKRREGTLVYGKDHKLDQRDRIVVHHAVTVLGLLLIARRAVVEAEQRVAGDILSEAFSGRLAGGALERRLERLGFPASAPVAVVVVEVAPDSDAGLLNEVAWTVDTSVDAHARAARTTVFGRRIVAVASDADPRAIAEGLARDLDASPLVPGMVETRIGVGDASAVRDLRQSYLTALFALRAAPEDRRIVSPEDLGSYGLLLGAQSRPVLERFVGSVLGPLMERDRSRSSELLASVKAYVAAGGRWEQGAGALGVHRHTLRYRVRRAEELLGRDLSAEDDRLEVWLALKAAEVLEE